MTDDAGRHNLELVIAALGSGDAKARRFSITPLGQAILKLSEGA